MRADRNDPDDHAFVRCMRGAAEHWHKLHAPEHHCCPITYQERKAAMPPKGEFVELPLDPIETPAPEPPKPPPCDPNCANCRAARDDVESR